MVWFAADTHFYHDAAPYFTGRNYANLSDMHRAIVENWNLCVMNEDTVYVLGDYAFGHNIQALHAITKLLHGKKILIRGNHDVFTPAQYINAGFAKYYDTPILIANDLLLSHEPIAAIQGDGLYNLHGHTHGRPFLLQSPRHFCVSLECIGMRPISIKEIGKRKALGL